MFGILLRIFSLLTYLGMVNYFFSNWSKTVIKHGKSYQITWMSSVLFVVLFCILSSAFLSNTFLPYVNILLSAILIYSIAMLNSVPYVNAIVWTTILISLNLICEMISLYCTKIITGLDFGSYNSHTFLIISVCLTVLFGLLGIVMIKFSILNKNESNLSINKSSMFLLIAIPILSIIILFSFLTRNAQPEKNHLSEVAITGSVILLNICVVFLYRMTIDYQKQQYDISINKKNIEVEYRLLNEMKKNRKNILKLKHDLKNQYLTLLGLIKNEESTEAINYIKGSIDVLEPHAKIYTSDGVLNFLLNEKLAEAENKHIKIDHHIFISNNIKINKDILTIVIGNLIDNAFQASMRLDPKDRHVNIDIKLFNKDLLIEVSNNFNPEEILSRKHRKDAGLGMKSVDDFVKQIGGLYRHWTENNKYLATVIIFNVY